MFLSIVISINCFIVSVIAINQQEYISEYVSSDIMPLEKDKKDSQLKPRKY